MVPLKDQLTEVEKAYLAGIVDGEGSMGYYFHKAKNRYEATLSIVNTESSIMTWIKDRIDYGNFVSARKQDASGRRKHVVHVWRINNKTRVKDFLEAITPYLVTKQEQANVLLNLWATEGKDYVEQTPEVLENRHAVSALLKQLKHSHRELTQGVA